jgi:hypothetical protein
VRNDGINGGEGRVGGKTKHAAACFRILFNDGCRSLIPDVCRVRPPGLMREEERVDADKTGDLICRDRDHNGETFNCRQSSPATNSNKVRYPAACMRLPYAHLWDKSDFPLRLVRAYTPQTALLAEMSEVHRALHTERVIIVNPASMVRTTLPLYTA